MSEPVALRLDADTRKRLDQLAKTTERSRSALAAGRRCRGIGARRPH